MSDIIRTALVFDWVPTMAYDMDYDDKHPYILMLEEQY